MRAKTSKTAMAAFALGALACLIWMPSSTQANEPEEAKKSVKIPGLMDKDALEHFPLQPFNVPVIRNGRITRILTISITMETKGGENMVKVMARRYALQDAFLRDIHGVASFTRADGRTIDARVVKTRLMAISDRLLGSGVVESVLVVSIFDRAMS